MSITYSADTKHFSDEWCISGYKKGRRLKLGLRETPENITSIHIKLVQPVIGTKSIALTLIEFERLGSCVIGKGDQTWSITNGKRKLYII